MDQSTKTEGAKGKVKEAVATVVGILLILWIVVSVYSSATEGYREQQRQEDFDFRVESQEAERDARDAEADWAWKRQQEQDARDAEIRGIVQDELQKSGR